ncbi:hypothetical protein HMPREF1092_03249 [Clostridium thermobutyricum]|uniref:Uncharacterized protein n=1 Tax=Clostridium thermobutyricum TaxID=29372 RepID=N9XTT0_9CLOT|nr:hypothetical protein [Clostridium thermobutyricum]ENY99363.1 hypothetical protein HMPREF1092_03249 [Clostridium thermobutyricum]
MKENIERIIRVGIEQSMIEVEMLKESMNKNIFVKRRNDLIYYYQEILKGEITLKSFIEKIFNESSNLKNLNYNKLVIRNGIVYEKQIIDGKGSYFNINKIRLFEGNNIDENYKYNGIFNLYLNNVNLDYEDWNNINIKNSKLVVNNELKLSFLNNINFISTYFNNLCELSYNKDKGYFKNTMEYISNINIHDYKENTLSYNSLKELSKIVSNNDIKNSIKLLY